MALDVECPDCSRIHELPDEMAGKKVRCKCGAVVAAPNVSSSAIAAKPGSKATRVPAKKTVRRKVDESTDVPTNRTWLIGGLIGAGTTIVVLIVVLAVVMTRPSADPQVAAIAEFPPVQQPQFQPPPQWKPQQPAAPKINPPVRVVENSVVPAQPAPKVAPPPEVRPVGKAWQWTVEVDPGTVKIDPIKAKPAVPLPISIDVVLPTTASEYVAIKSGYGNGVVWQSVHVPTMKAQGAIQGKIELNHPALSPDGKFLAGADPGHGGGVRSIQVYSLPNSKFVNSFPLQGTFPDVRFVDFLADGKVIAAISQAGQVVFRVWDPATGLEVRSFEAKGRIEKAQVAWSPGRRYLATGIGDFRASEVCVFDVNAGKECGRIAINESSSLAPSFSPDGEEIAILAESSGSDSGTVLHVFKVAGGERVAEIKWAKSPKHLVPGAHSYHGRAVEWTPEKNAFLLYGEILVANSSGATLFIIPRAPHDSSHYARAFIGPDHIVMVGHVASKNFLQTTPMLRTEIAKLVTKAAAKEESQAALELAPIKDGDRAGATKITNSAEAAEWKGTTTPIIQGKTSGSLTVRAAPNDTIEILLGSFKSGQAVILARESNDPLAGRDVIRADRYDLTAGKFLNSVTLFTTEAVKTSRFVLPGARPEAKFDSRLSPDGELLAIRRESEPNRVDLWNLKTGKHVGGFNPHGLDGIDDVAPVDSTKVWTTGGGSIVLWSVPEFKAIAEGSGWRGRMVVSPNQKQIVASSKRRLELLDAATGERLGSFAESVAGDSLTSGFFSPTGKEFVAAFDSGVKTGGGIHNLVRFDLAKGQTIGELIPTAPSFRSNDRKFHHHALAYAAPGYVIFDKRLYAWSFSASPLFHFTGESITSRTAPDGAVRSLAMLPSRQVALVSPSVLPPNAALLATRLPGAQPVVPPGSFFSLQASGGPPTWMESTQRNFNAEVERLGHKVGAGGFQVTVNAALRATGKSNEYVSQNVPAGGFRPLPIPGRPGMPGQGGQRMTINEQEVRVNVRIVDAQGVEVYANSVGHVTPSSITTQKDANVEAAMTEAMWNSAHIPSIAPLARRYRIDGQTYDLPISINWTN